MSFPEAQVKKKKNPALTSLLPLDNSFLGVRSLGCESFATEPIWFLRPHVCHQGVLRDIVTMHIHDTSAEEREGLLPHSHANTGRGGIALSFQTAQSVIHSFGGTIPICKSSSQCQLFVSNHSILSVLCVPPSSATQLHSCSRSNFP